MIKNYSILYLFQLVILDMGEFIYEKDDNFIIIKWDTFNNFWNSEPNTNWGLIQIRIQEILDSKNENIKISEGRINRELNQAEFKYCQQIP